MTCLTAVLMLFSCVSFGQQDFFLLDSYSNIYKSTGGGTCSNLQLNSCAPSATDIAYYKDTLYSISYTGFMYRSIISKPAVPCTYVANFGTSVNSLTVDNNGTVYGAGGQTIVSYTPSTGLTKIHGSMPSNFSSSGDLTFYQGKLYLAAVLINEASTSALIEVNIANPSLSSVFMRLKAINVYGCITLPKSCDANGFFITHLLGNQSLLTEINMANKQELASVCNYNVTVYGAASFTEGGTRNKPQIDSIVKKNPCVNEGVNSGSINIFTGSSGSLQTYTLNGSTSNQTGSFNNLQPGLYTIRVKSELNCILDTAVSISVVPLPSVAVQGVNPKCSNDDGKIGVQSLIIGMNVRYSLNNGAYQSIDTFRNLPAGKYTVTAMNENGCTVKNEVILTLPILDTTGTGINTRNSTCNGSNGSIQAFVPNAAKPVTFLLNNASPSVTGSYPALAPGSYLLSISDVNGCRLNTPVLIQTTPVPVIDSISAPAICSGQGSNGSIRVFTKNTGETFTYSLNNSVVNQSGVFTNLQAGLYRIRILNQYNCSRDTSVSIQSVANPAITIASHHPSCRGNDGSITVQPGAGGNLIYALNGGAYDKTSTFSRLSAGTFTITAKNEAGCTTVTTVILTMASLNSKSISIRSSGPACTNNDGMIAVTVQNGTPPISFSLNGTVSTTGTFTDLRAAAYKLTVTDGNSCSFDTTLTLVQAPLVKPATEVRKTEPSCPNAYDGGVALSVSGSDGPYLVSINNSSFTPTHVYPALAAGRYSIVIQNKNKCLVDSFSVQLTVPANAVCSSIYFPNAFTPGNDGRNDLFRPVVRGVLEKYVLMIFNRAGQKVFETRDPKNGWNGTVGQVPQSTGAFVWFSGYKFFGDNQKERTEKGTVMVIR